MNNKRLLIIICIYLNGKNNIQEFFLALLVGVDDYLFVYDNEDKFSGIRIYLVELYNLTISDTSEFS